MLYSFIYRHSICVLRHTQISKELQYQWVLLYSSTHWHSAITPKGFRTIEDAMKLPTDLGCVVQEHKSFLEMFTYWASTAGEDL